MDGWITIGTQIDDSKFNKQLSMLEKKYANKEIDIEVTTGEYNRAENELNRINDALDNAIKRENDLKEKIKAEQEARYQSRSLLETYEKQMSSIVDEQLKLYGAWEKQDMVVEKLGGKLEKQKNDLMQISKDMDKIANRQNSINIANITEHTNKIGKNLSNIIKKVARWGLAIFGIRSAYLAVRSAMNIITQDDEQLKADIDYIKTALAYTLEPVVRKIVDLIKTVLIYIGWIIQQWTGKNIFANANKHLQKSVGSAKELKKQLSGFDEMNILGANTTSSSGGGVSPGIDLTNLEDQDVPKWMRWIVRNKGKVTAGLLGIAGALTAIKFGLDGIKAFGIGLAIYGIITAIESLIKFLKDPTFDNFTDTLKGIALAVTGVAIAVGAWPVAFAGAIAYVVLLLAQNLDKITKKFEEFNKWLDKNVLGWLKKNFGKLGEIIYAPFKNIILIFEGVFEVVIGGIKRFIVGVVKLFKGDLIGGITDIIGGISQILLGPFIVFYNGVMQIFRDIRYAFNDLKKSLQGGGLGSYGYGGSMGGRAKGGIFYPSKLPKLALGGIINMPGSGVPYHGATIGERGAEAVVPLTDNQQMALLGETIGRYVTINATIPVYAYNREVDRQMRRIQAEDNFASNR